MEWRRFPTDDGLKGRAPNAWRTEQHGQRTVVWLAGEHDADTSSLLGAALDDIVAAAEGDVVVDLTDVDFIDASTLSVLVRWEQVLASRHRRFTVSGPHGGPLRMLELGGLAHLVEPSQPQAKPERFSEVGALGTWVEVPAPSPTYDNAPVPNGPASVGP